MRQKLTWIIPGILVTLLLGLLWAMPAFGAEAGTVSFLDSKGGKAVTHASLNGVGVDGDGIWFQIDDSDLDTVTKRVKKDALEDDVNGEVASPSGEDWHNIQDMNGDGEIDNRDFTGAVITYTGEGAARKATEVVISGVDLLATNPASGNAADDNPACTIDFNKSNGKLSVTGCSAFDHDKDSGDSSNVSDNVNINAIEYWIKKKTVIGARNGTGQTATLTVTATGDSPDTTPGNAASYTLGDAQLTAKFGVANFKPEDSLVNNTFGDDTGGNLVWVELLRSKIPDLTTRVIAPLPTGATEHGTDDTPVVAVEKEIKGLIKAYNKKDAAKSALNVVVSVTTIAHSRIGATTNPAPAGSRQVNLVSVNITNNPVDADADVTGNQITQSTVCLGLVPKAGVTDTVAGDWDCTAALQATDGDPAGSGKVVYVASDVAVEVEYVGSADTIYPTGDNRLGKKDEVGRVIVSSNNHSISAIAQETGAATGIFGVNVKICDAEDCSASQAGETQKGNVSDADRTVMLPVDATGDVIRVTYKDADPGADRTATIPLDPNGPAFSNMSPASGASGREHEPTVSFTVADGEAGLSSSDSDHDSIYVVAGLFNEGETTVRDTVLYSRNELDLSSATGGYDASVSIDEGKDNDDELSSQASGLNTTYEIRWWAIAVDKAGNVGITDQNGDTKCEVVGNDTLQKFTIPDGQTQAQAQEQAKSLMDVILATIVPVKDKAETKDVDESKDSKGCDGYKIRVDAAKPELSSATTGTWLDGDKEKSGTAGKRTSVVAVFNEALDCDSVSADDFTVGGSTPNGVTCKGKNVYLDVDELAPDAKPKVMVADASVTDKAGNAIGGTDASRTVTAADGIAAKLTITVTGTGEGARPVTKKSITVTVASDEPLSGRPDVVIQMVGTDYSLGSDKGGDANPTGTANEWSISKDLTDDGLYNVNVTATDRGGSLKHTTGATSLTKDMLKTSGAIFFEVDNEVQAPTWPKAITANDNKTDNPDIFISATFTDEGKEYGLKAAADICRKDSDNKTEADPATKDPDSDGNCGTGYTKGTTMVATDDPAMVKTDFDSHGTVTLMEATFNGDDVTSDVASRDNSLFVYRPGGLSVGDHKLSLKVSDNAGNEKSFSLDFAVTERQAFKLDINPGANLISFPADPVDGSIDAVFGGDSDVTTVVTYSNSSGLWMTATRSGSGSFSGDLTMVDGDHAYWVVSDGANSLSVVLVRSGGISTTPAAIPVVAGWNLVPVADAQQRKAGTGIDAQDYFANIDADVAYGYDSITGVMERLSVAADASDKDDMVKVGSGYWVYANKAGVIIP